MKVHKHMDRQFLIVTALLVIVGFFIFSSASLGLLARGKETLSGLFFTQFGLGLGLGFLVLFLFSHIPYRSYRPYVPYVFLFSVFLTTLVFVPGVGYEANGAQRWLSIFGVSLQPGEILKVSFVLFLAWYYSTYFKKLHDIRYSLGGFLVALSVPAIILFLQPDTGTFLIMGVAGVAVMFAAGIRFKHLLLLALIAILGVLILAFSRPYLLDRVQTFIDPTSDPRGSGYQIKQSLIAVGSGGWFGRGFGQSIQKFSYLPEPSSDSIFSVYAEEFGFLGGVILISLFLYFAMRGLHIAARAPDRFGGLTVVGIVILILTQSYINIGSMIGLMPLTGEPLTFISRGGSSLMFALMGVGIILNISRYQSLPKKAV